MKTKIGIEDELPVKTNSVWGTLKTKFIREDEIRLEDEIRPEDRSIQRSRLRNNASLKTRNSALQTKLGREDEIRP